MKIVDLLLALSERQVILEAAGDRLRYTPRDALTPELLASLKDHKAEVLRFFNSVPPKHATLDCAFYCDVGVCVVCAAQGETGYMRCFQHRQEALADAGVVGAKPRGVEV